MPRKKPLPPAVAAIQTIKPGDPHQPHAGNVAALRARLLALIDADDLMIDRFASGAVSWEDVQTWADFEITGLAATLIGRNADLEPQPGWNMPGAIDVHLRRVLNIDQHTSPLNTVKEALERLLVVSRRVREDCGMGTLDADAGTAVLIHFISVTAAHLLDETPPAAPG